MFWCMQAYKKLKRCKCIVTNMILCIDWVENTVRRFNKLVSHWASVFSFSFAPVSKKRIQRNTQMLLIHTSKRWSRWSAKILVEISFQLVTHKRRDCLRVLRNFYSSLRFYYRRFLVKHFICLYFAIMHFRNKLRKFLYNEKWLKTLCTP